MYVQRYIQDLIVKFKMQAVKEPTAFVKKVKTLKVT